MFLPDKPVILIRETAINGISPEWSGERSFFCGWKMPLSKKMGPDEFHVYAGESEPQFEIIPYEDAIVLTHWSDLLERSMGIVP